MNIDELEKLARAALDPTFPWPDRDAMRQGLWQAVELEFIEKSTPAAILELIEQHKAMKEALTSVLKTPGDSDGWLDKVYLALSKIKGESNE